MKRNLWLLLVGLLLLVFILLRDGKQSPAPSTSQPPSGPAAPAPAPPLKGPAASTTQTPPPPPADQAPAITPEVASLALTAIDNLGFTFRDYAAALGGNPVGTNAEITASLLGDNAKQIKFPLPEGSTLNDKNELCDPWRTPWFFHQISGTKMEIRSAGPDRILYNTDDFVR